MLLLGIETSCDETAAAVVDDGHDVRANIVASQAAQHAQYGGVIPELAAREHLRAIVPVVNEALTTAGVSTDDIQGIAVTANPGLLSALLVGVNHAKGLAAALNVPLIGVNHFLGHIFGALIDRRDILTSSASYPIIALVVSGGHTALVEILETGECSLIGQTLDDAAGEAFDKAAKIMDLGYPGGPIIDRLSRNGDAARYSFPRGLTGGGGTPLKADNQLNFSFSGVKTSLLHHVQKLESPVGDESLPQTWLDTIASYQEAIVDVLVRKTMWAVEARHAQTVIVCGGVACNSRLRDAFAAAAGSVQLLIAPPRYCTDNAAMIAGLAWYFLREGHSDNWSLDAHPRLRPFTRVPFGAA